MVQIVLPLKALVAADQVNNVRKMMSKIGEVVAMEGGRNALIMIDLAGNLRRIVEDLKSSESRTVPGREVRPQVQVREGSRSRDSPFAT